jgi:hypothetical protein
MGLWLYVRRGWAERERSRRGRCPSTGPSAISISNTCSSMATGDACTSARSSPTSTLPVVVRRFGVQPAEARAPQRTGWNRLESRT